MAKVAHVGPDAVLRMYHDANGVTMSLDGLHTDMIKYPQIQYDKAYQKKRLEDIADRADELAKSIREKAKNWLEGDIL